MVKTYIESLKLNIKSKLEYKASFIINSISQFAVFFTYYFTVIALFTKFNNIRGFNIYEILVCFAIIHFGYAINETFFRGLDKFEDVIIYGKLDRFLVRPRNILFQVLCSETDLIKIFRSMQALIVLFYALIKLKLVLSFTKIITLILMLLSSIIIFFSIFVITASYCFITIQGLEVRNLLTNGGKYLAQYPISIYKKGMMFFFTFIIPYGFINYYPLLYLLGKKTNPIYIISPLVVLLFLAISLLVFHIGLKHYNSTGS